MSQWSYPIAAGLPIFRGELGRSQFASTKKGGPEAALFVCLR